MLIVLNSLFSPLLCRASQSWHVQSDTENLGSQELLVMIIITDDGAVQAGTHARLHERSRVWRRRHFLSLCSETSVTVRHENHTVSTGFSRSDADAPNIAGSAVLYGNNDPISGQANSRVSVPYTEKSTLPGTCVDVSRFVVSLAGILPHWNRPLAIQSIAEIHSTQGLCWV